MFAQGCACHVQLLMHSGIVGRDVSKVGPELRGIIGSLLGLGEELFRAMERGSGLCLSDLQGPSEFLRSGVGNCLGIGPLLLGQIALPPEGALAVAVGDQHLVEEVMATVSTSRAPGVLLCGALSRPAVNHDDRGLEDSSVTGARDAVFTLD